MLGGWTQGKEGKKDDMQDSSILGAVLDFAEASKRFQRAAERNTRQEATTGRDEAPNSSESNGFLYIDKHRE
jgi:hypothetical protein